MAIKHSKVLPAHPLKIHETRPSPMAEHGFWLSVSRVLVQDLVDGGNDHFG
jgi:hypothetical protein